jgi:peptide/nickel transport system substrate-binding protein
MSRYSDDGIDIEDLVRHTSLSRRQALKLGMLAPAGAALLAACANDQGARTTGSSGGGGPATMSVAQTPRHETVIVEQVAFTVFDSFNVYVPNGANPANGFGEICQEYLWYLNFATAKITPWLATGYQYNRDYTQLTMSLDPKAHWNDGHPFTSTDVKFSIEMLQKHPTLLNSTAIDAEAKQVRTPDDHTVVIDLDRRNTRYHYGFICAITSGFHVMPEHLWGSQDPTSYKFNPPVLTGPYKLSKVYRDQMMFVWEKDPNYWNRDKISFAPRYVVYRSSPSADSDLQQFRSADVDESQVKWPLVSSLVAQGTPNVVATTMWDPCPHFFAVNCHPSKGLLADYRMRQALSCLVDRQKVAKVLYQPATAPAVYPWAPFSQNRKWENDKIAARYPHTYDPAKAAQILDGLGAKKGPDGKRTYNGQPLSYTIACNMAPPDANFQTCQLLQNELQAQGIGATVVVDTANFPNRLAQGNYDILLSWLCNESMDPYQVYTSFSGAKGVAAIGQPPLAVGQNPYRFQNDDFDGLLARVDGIDPNSPSAKGAYDQLLDAFFKLQPIIMVNQMLDPFSNNTTWWSGWPTNDNLYITPNNWWGQFMFVVSHLKATGKR